MKVAVFGLGYVGSVTAAALARDGHEVVGVDVSQPKIEALRAGRAPVLEPGLEELIAALVRGGRLRATDDPAAALADAELSLICVGTPSRADGSLELEFVKQVASQIGSKLSVTARGHRVVVRSTVLPGSTRGAVLPEIERASGRAAGDGWDICVNPEFLREGASLADYDEPTRILVGERVPGAGRRVLDLYERIRAPRFSVALEVAEAIKYTDNAFHALKVAFANEVGRVWSARGADPVEVMSIFAQDRKLNISPLYLRPGFAFGGSCLPKDVRALRAAAHGAAIPIPLLDAILPSNEAMVRRAFDAVLATEKRRVALLGLAFKPGTDDLRESPLLELAKRLIGEGLELAIHDAFVALARLHGTNRAFLEQRIPHIARLLRASVDEAVADAEVVVIGHAGALYERDDDWRASGKTVLRLT
ncbi:MAG TPA: nucleotide sugar dehydrogenase [Myxococcota bacterium]|nr:nucleotide sugar dehydrogenase [Myxococcota bacterium]